MGIIHLFLILLLFPFQIYARSYDIKGIMQHIKHTYRYESDIVLFNVDDYWQSPQEFYKNKAGDCEDFAFFIRELLNGKHGYVVKTYAVIFNNKLEGHAINIIYDILQANVYITSNADLFTVNRSFTDIQTIKWFIEKVWGERITKIYLIANDTIYGKQTRFTNLYNYILIE